MARRCSNAYFAHPRVRLELDVSTAQRRPQKGVGRGAAHAIADGDLVAAQPERMLAIEIIRRRQVQLIGSIQPIAAHGMKVGRHVGNVECSPAMSSSFRIDTPL